MGDYLLLLVATVLVNNFVLVKFLGLCPFMGVSNKLETAIGMSAATTFVLTLASVCSYLVNAYILAPLDLIALQTLSFILVIAVVVQFTEMVVHKTSPTLYRLLGIFLPLIAVNCAILGGSLFMQAREIPSLDLAFNYGLSSGIGWFLAILAIAAIREKIRYSAVPAPLRGLGITFIITGLMGIGFQSFGGMLTGDNEPPVAVEEAVVKIEESPIENKEKIEESQDDQKEVIAGIN
jgi:RnfABCDGE-type electron transport complex A subunit